MRAKFVEELKKIAVKDKEIVFLTGDLGFGVLESLRDELKYRFINAGVAEQNMVGVAAGLAYAGFKPWIYSIAPFVTTKVLEQLKNDVCYQNFNVKIIGTGGGFDYEAAGHTHHTLDDVAVLSALNNIDIYLPSVIDDISPILKSMYTHIGPDYLRLPKARTVTINVPPYQDVRNICQGNKITLIIIGSFIDKIGNIIESLDKKIIDLWTIGKIPFKITSPLKQSILKTKNVVIVEEHGLIGGVGQLLTHKILTENIRVNNFLHFYVNNSFLKTIGSREYYLKKTGLDSKSIIKKIKGIL